MIKCEKCGLEFSDRVYDFHVERCNPKKNKNKNKNESKIGKEQENNSKLDKEEGKETKSNEDE